MARQVRYDHCGHARRLLDIDFTPWVFYVCPAHHVIYVSGWTASNNRPALLQWTYDLRHSQHCWGDSYTYLFLAPEIFYTRIIMS